MEVDTKANVIAKFTRKLNKLIEYHQSVCVQNIQTCLNSCLNTPYSIDVLPDKKIFIDFQKIKDHCDYCLQIQMDIGMLSRMINSVDSGRRIPHAIINEFFKRKTIKFKKWNKWIRQYHEYFESLEQTDRSIWEPATTPTFTSIEND